MEAEAEEEEDILCSYWLAAAFCVCSLGKDSSTQPSKQELSSNAGPHALPFKVPEMFCGLEPPELVQAADSCLASVTAAGSCNNQHPLHCYSIPCPRLAKRFTQVDGVEGKGLASEHAKSVASGLEHLSPNCTPVL